MSGLAQQLRSLTQVTGGIGLVRLGQASVALAGGDCLVLIDPFLSPHPDRLVPPPLDPVELDCVDVVLVTHEHWDHLDGPTCAAIARVALQATFLCPEPIVDQLVAAGVPAERVSGTRPGQSYRRADVTIWPIAAKHGLHATDAYSFGEVDGVPRFLGYVVELAGVRLYHAGDTIPYEGLAESVGVLQPDVALLPINGRDWYRERLDIVGNLDAREAAQLAAAIGAELLVPLHYDMFAANLADPGELVRFVRERELALGVLVLPVGHPAVICPARRRGR